ncbi:MAG: hypothetical protein JNK02_01725 [Planctomycetes bacterium]|nr:hypothetical protein [Planctomycetota bacterium]
MPNPSEPEGERSAVARWLLDGDTWKSLAIVGALAWLVFVQVPSCDKRRAARDAALLKRQYEFLAEYGIRGSRADDFLQAAEERELDIGHPRGGDPGSNSDE